jgi:hypothetical protein
MKNTLKTQKEQTSFECPFCHKQHFEDTMHCSKRCLRAEERQVEREIKVIEKKLKLQKLQDELFLQELIAEGQNTDPNYFLKKSDEYVFDSTWYPTKMV